MEWAALIPAFSRREKENMRRGFRRAEPGVGWNGSRRLGRLEFHHVAVREMRHPLPPGEGWGEGEPERSGGEEKSKRPSP